MVSWGFSAVEPGTNSGTKVADWLAAGAVEEHELDGEEQGQREGDDGGGDADVADGVAPAGAENADDDGGDEGHQQHAQDRELFDRHPHRLSDQSFALHPITALSSRWHGCVSRGTSKKKASTRPGIRG